MTDQRFRDSNPHQGHYDEAFVYALAAAAGLQVAKFDPDFSGVDLHLKLPGATNGNFPCVEMQVKSWSQPVRRNGHFRYDRLNERQFNALAGAQRVPRFLVLVIVPPAASDYTVAAPARLTLAHAAYWQDLSGEEPIANPSRDRYTRVLVPETNLLTVTSLLKLVHSAGAVIKP
ncbi:DUF4365 domain-containing protein [Nocardia sp. CC227C]|uniref:DUF4365 domain-containing protein n=1 Tax=Nocardia sp. CC227C TaxID=3044562 RepID=UPI00278C5101|nr:DUF4365 domain-containing protein [Nocardia sp. CC227C]